jgi:endonuclease G
MRLPVELLKRSEAAFQAAPAAVEAMRTHIATTSALALDGAEHFERRRDMIAASAREPAEIAFERYIDGNQLLSINYLQIGYAQSRAVGRIRYFDKTERKTAYATGFMVTPELMLTNQHVFPAPDAATLATLVEDAAIEFDFEFDVNGQKREVTAHPLDPNTFFYSNQALDIALVAVAPLDASGKRKLSERGYLILNGKLGKAGTGDFATIVQHPDGKEKQISLRNNEIIDRTQKEFLIYKSDTAQGSSGAPVFNDEWQVIALHSSGVAKKDAQGNYLDKDEQIIEVVNGRIDEARVVWLSNRGVRISAIIDHLTTSRPVADHPLIKAFSSPAYTDSRPFTALPLPTFKDSERAIEAPVVAQAPAVAVPPIEIHISIGGAGGAAQPTVRTSMGPMAASALALLETEKKLEDEQDYSACLGFDPDFMGVRIGMPTPSSKLRKKLAYLRDSPSSCILKYHHYSTIHHAVRRVPVVSAINVHGRYRFDQLDESTRKDKWLRDNRIDYEVQLNDDWYAKSGFDKGHLSRREDAEWGRTVDAAKMAADMTCSYANAVPQVPAFNRAIFGYKGQWGRLEQEALEQGVQLESGKAARICVFSGPLFLDDDPTYSGVQVALSCFKVIVWYDKDGNLRTTAYRLSQESLVGDIEFEALRFDRIFKPEQKPLAWIEKHTGLTFAQAMRDTDSFVD